MENSLQTLRLARGYSQEELGRLIGVSRQTIISIEKGRYAPSLALAFKIARQFDTTIESVFTPE
ncbi:hypothetical protein MB46_07490 [Arthrobacter alpinus]|uniref:helix-turn-helix transcriptional regulator n=1 Tax=Arthrobacter alpinus TaxID=656366 RepID=UPI0005CA1B5E|nr:helix-turn-helix transcriptional regulator [Arthrobacter alpinus]ALV45359.1 hypothetical protein MB46_07490 [Arthrobacter alpinus]